MDSKLIDGMLISDKIISYRWQDKIPSETAKGVIKLKCIASKLKNVQLEKNVFSKRVNAPIFKFLCSVLPNFLKNYIEKKSPGLIGSIVCRTKFIDNVIEKYSSVIEQVVIIGSGYDDRAFRNLNTQSKIRIPDKIKIYELDLLETLQIKRKLIACNQSRCSRDISLIKFDAEKDSLADCLIKANVPLAQPTLFIMEGFVYYINKASLKNMFREISQFNGIVVFDYFVNDFIQKNNLQNYYGAEEYIRNVRNRLFEKQVTGFSNDFDNWLIELAFKNLINLKANEAEKLYLNSTGLKDLGFVRYVSAETALLNCDIL